MLPHLQIDMSSNEPKLLTTDANSLFEMKLNDIKSYKPSKFHKELITNEKDNFKKTQITSNVNKIKTIKRFGFFKDDIKTFTKKDNFLVSISK